MSWSDESWSLTVRWPEPTQYNTTINNYYYGNNYVESDEYDEDYDEECDEEYCDEDDGYDDEDYDEEDCDGDDDYEVTDRNSDNNAPAPPVVINNNVRVNSRSYSQTTYGDLNITITNNDRIVGSAVKAMSPLMSAALKVAERLADPEVMSELDKYLEKTAVAAASTALTGRKEAAVISLFADGLRRLSDRYIG